MKFKYAALIAAHFVLVAPAIAQVWGPIVTVSETMDIHRGRLCVGVAISSTVGCPSTAPSLTTAGDVSVTGNLSAAKFLGDGSALTGVSSNLSTGTSGSVVYRDNAGTLFGSTALYVSSSGNVGIGTDAPSSTLSILSSDSNQLTIQNTNTAQYAGAKFFLRGPDSLSTQAATSFHHGNNNEGGTQGFFAISQFNKSYAWQRHIATYDYNSQYWQFLTNGNIRLRIDSSGNVGIGTTAPASRLEVSDTQDTGGKILTITNGSRALNTTKAVTLAFNGFDTVGTQKTVGYIQAIPGNANWTTGHLAFSPETGDAAPSEVMRLTGTGNVGIGTTAPANTLDVSGTSRVTSNSEVVGTISATEVKIASSNTACTPEKYGTLRFDPTTKKMFICKPH